MSALMSDYLYTHPYSCIPAGDKHIRYLLAVLEIILELEIWSDDFVRDLIQYACTRHDTRNHHTRQIVQTIKALP